MLITLLFRSLALTLILLQFVANQRICYLSENTICDNMSTAHLVIIAYSSSQYHRHKKPWQICFQRVTNLSSHITLLKFIA